VVIKKAAEEPPAPTPKELVTEHKIKSISTRKFDIAMFIQILTLRTSYFDIV
jgi:hypothetical protein